MIAPATREAPTLVTPIRGLGPVSSQGWIQLSEPASSYRDGGEERVQEILRGSLDLTSASVEGLQQAQSWAERYHLTPNRSNVVRPLRLPPDARVLEIGAGCGAVTRYLGETCAVVDALEPVPSRATAAALRNRDLASVQVFVGMLADVPRQPTYDVIVVVGVLEYVGHGTADSMPYAEFLANIRDLLVDGGSLVLAIENKLGVKYLAGAPEDHSSRVFDSIEGYPGNSPARTFSRLELIEMLQAAGLTATTRIAFPDYKLPRVLFAPELMPPGARSLLYRIPNFPSPDWALPRQPLADERLLWRSLVDAGLDVDTGNSLVMLAGKGAESQLWDPACAAVFYSIDRRPQFAVQTRVEVEGSRLLFRRTTINPQPVPGSLRINPDISAFLPSEDFVDVFVDCADARSVRLLTGWVALLEAHAGDSWFPMDLVPRNLVVDSDDRVHMIDDEWRSELADQHSVLGRGVLLLALQLSQRRPSRAAWDGCTTFRDVALQLGRVVGLVDDWLAETVQAEADFQVTVAPQATGSSRQEQLEHARFTMNSMLDCGLRSPGDFIPFADQLRIDELTRTVAAADEARAVRQVELGALQAALAGAEGRWMVAEQELSAVRLTISWRITAPLRWVRSRLPRR